MSNTLTPAPSNRPAEPLTPKTRATAADARRLAASLEPEPVPGGCRHCGGHTEPGRLACAWCRRVLGGEQ